MNSYQELIARIRQVRTRWRSQVLVKGISLFCASTIALLILGVWGADLFGFKPPAVWTLRLLMGGMVVFIAWYFLYAPLRKRIDDVQIAQYIEERYPQLEDRLVAAVEYGGQNRTSGIIDLLIKDALDKAGCVEISAFLNRGKLLFFGALGAAALLGLLLLLNWGPAFWPYGFNRLYVPWTEASPASPMAIRITPGDIEIPKGADQQVSAQLIGFDSSDVRLFIRNESAAAWNSSSMEPDRHGSSFQYLLADIQGSLRYYVESNNIRSPVYTVRILDVARVEKIDVTYNFPAYTGMALQTAVDEGDVSALEGTKVDLRIRLNRPAKSAHLLFNDRSVLDLVPSGSQEFTASFRVQRSGSYVVQITESQGPSHPGSREYTVEALEDEGPTVSVVRPMRDVRATNVEEVFSEAKAEDDIGVGRMELRYSVNGGPEKTAGLYGGQPPQPSVTGTHTFFLEEFALQPGDLVSYYAKAWDNNNVTGPRVATSDIYFIQIRPFDQKYVQNQQQGAGGAQSGESREALSKQQKDIISATFKVNREKGRMAEKERTDSLRSLALIQSRLQVQAQSVVDRMQRREAGQRDDRFRLLSEYLQNAVAEMKKAAAELNAYKPETALPQEQKSLQQLMRAESLFREIQVSFSQNGESGSGSQSNAEDLADLFELELNKLKNQYETLQRGEQRAQDQKTDDALQKLRELARRQEQLNERMRMLAQKGNGSGVQDRQSGQGRSSSGDTGSAQQQLMNEAEKLRRQLQRLSRERSSPQMNEAGNQLQKAIEEMRKSLNGPQRGKSSESSAQGLRALQQLEDAARRLAQGQQNEAGHDMDQAVEESRRLVREQKKIQEGLDELTRQKGRSDSSATAAQLKEDLVSRKKTLSEGVRNLEGRIQDLSRKAGKAGKEARSKLVEAAAAIQDQNLPQRILDGNDMIQNGHYEPQKRAENSIRNSLEGLSSRLESARNSFGQGNEGKLERAAGRARQLSEGLESMQQRMEKMRQGQGSRAGQQPGNQDKPGSGQGQPGLRSDGRSDRKGMDRNLQSGRSSPNSDVSGPSGDTRDAQGGRWDDEERQLSRELRQRLADVQELRSLLDRNSQVENLNKAIESLRRAGDYMNDSNPEQVARLKSAIDSMRKLELELARDLEKLNSKDRYFFAEENEIPGNYRKLVEEYYKSIAKSR